MPDVVIRAGNVVTPEGVIQSDIAIEDGLITANGQDLPGATQEVDARDLFVFPGVIDVHLHFNEPGRTEWEGAATGRRAVGGGGAGGVFVLAPYTPPRTL